MIRDTSLQAYITETVNGNINRNEKLIYELIKEYDEGISNYEISQKTGKPINSITGRTNSLIKKGLIEINGKKTNLVTGKLNQTMKVHK